MTSPLRADALQPSDRELVSAIANGQLEALGALFDRHEPSLRRYFGRLGIGWSDAEDLVQATFLEVVHASERFDPQYAVRSWLFGIATVIARRHRRALGQAIARVAAWADNVRSAPAAVRTPADAFDTSAEVERIERAFARLSPKKREVLVLITLEGLSGEDVARLLGIPVNTVWTRLHHARRELRAALGEGQP